MSELRSANVCNARTKKFLLATAAAFCVALPAYAQTATPAASESSEIVVTAQRRSERLEDVPASVAVVNAEQLQAAGVTRFQDLGNAVTGVQISRSGTYSQPSIRGISTVIAAGGQETNVAVYVDGFYTSDQLSINQDFGDISNVQVLKGPQGTLYGRNATGGAILIETRQPSDEFEFDAAASIAEYGEHQLQGFVSVPLTDDIAFSLNGYFRENDGYFTDINDFAPANRRLGPAQYAAGDGDEVGNFENRAWRAKLRITPNDQWAFTLGYNYAYLNDPRSFMYGPVSQIRAPTISGGYGAAQLARNRDDTSLNYKPISESETQQLTILTEYRGDSFTATSHTSYQEQDDLQVYDFDASPADSFFGYQINERETFTQALDFTWSVTDRFELLSGLFYYNDSFVTPIGVSRYVLSATTAADARNTLDLQTQAWGGYVDGTYEVADNWFLTLGVRYAEDEKELYRFEDAPTFSTLAPPPPLLPPDPSIPPTMLQGNQPGGSEGSWNSYTTRAVLRYEYTPGSNLYASYSQGFKSGTINANFPYNVLDPETVDGYEIGWKTARDSYRAEAAIYYYDYSDNQVGALNPNVQGLSTQIINAGGSEVYGIEGSINWDVTENLSLHAGVAYNHARYRDFVDANNTTITGVGLNTNATGDWSDRRMVRAPDWSGNIGFSYDRSLFGGEFALSGTTTFSSRYAPQNASYLCNFVSVATPVVHNECLPGNYESAPGRFEENGWIVTSGQAAWTEPSGHTTFTIFGNNIFDERYKIVSSPSSNSTYEMYNQPQTFGVRIGYSY